MDNIKVLEQIGLKKVSDETHIEQKYIKYMVDCDFEKLNRINTLGFVKILSRAYNLDLSAWVEAFETHWLETHKDDENKGLFIVVDEKKQSRKFLVLILLIIIIATASFLFALFENKINLDDYIQKEDTSFVQSKIVEDTQKTLDEINISVDAAKVEEFIEDQNQTENIEVIEEVESNATIADEVIEETEEVVQVENAEEIKENNEVTTVEDAEQVSERFEQEAIVSPNIKIWLGVIYLDNKRRRSYLGEGNFSIDTSRDQIITTGHGSFNLLQNGQITEFKKQAPLRFLVKDSNITEITFSEFKELNEGESW